MKKRKHLRKKLGGAITAHRDKYGVKRVRHVGRVYLNRHGEFMSANSKERCQGGSAADSTTATKWT